MSIWQKGCSGAAMGGFIGGFIFSGLFLLLVRFPKTGGDSAAMAYGITFIIGVIPFSIFLGSVIGSILMLRFGKTREGEERAKWYHYLLWPAMCVLGGYVVFQAILLWMRAQY